MADQKTKKISKEEKDKKDKKTDLGMLEEDDDFEEFPAEDWDEKEVFIIYHYKSLIVTNH